VDPARPAVPADEALRRLQAGNARFVAGASTVERRPGGTWPAGTSGPQRPFATVLGCSDSRVPVEMVFDQDAGDLFVVRVAGQVVAPSQLGSVEYAAAELDTRLVVVLGHTHCGAVGATLRELRQPNPAMPPALRSIVERIRPAVAPLLDDRVAESPEALSSAAVRANALAAAAALRRESALIAALVEERGLRIVAGLYDLDSGAVTFLDGS
jgi:carbonic anhydrase